MPKLLLSKRHTWAIVTATIMLVALVASVAIIRYDGRGPARTTVTAASELTRIDDLAAAAEARVALASLRANLVDQPSTGRSGTHARRLSQALAATLEREGARAESWARMSEQFSAFRQDLQIGDPTVRARVAELEAELRIYTP